MAIMMVVQTQITAGLCSFLITMLTLVLGSGNLRLAHFAVLERKNTFIYINCSYNIINCRSYSGLPEWLVYLTYGTQTRYLGSFLNHEYLWNGKNDLPFSKEHTCQNGSNLGDTDSWLCRFSSGQDFLRERYTRDNDFHLQLVSEPNLSLSISLGFSVGLIILNSLLYLVPLPGFIKAKFRQ